ncbi:hypothetical protein ACIRQY_31205 [Streptomyces sp. NPDC101490]|uniref:DUF7927 domain-containing protein n=1 Tax=Streptomyces sp. NPDC101490 TaxID=3366143 RepID=UPI00382AC3B9
MRRTDAAGVSPGFGSSSGHVRIPAGAEVAYARLFWGGNDGTHRGPGGADLRRCDLAGADVDPSPGDPATTAPVLRIGSGPTVPVRVDSMVTDPADSAGAHFYTGESDVTAAFAGVSGTDARVTVGNVWAAGGKGCAAGWSLTVVHRFPGPVAEPAPVRRTVSVYGGHVVQRPDSPATTVTVDGFRRGAGPVRAGVVAFGGDRNAPGDVFRVDGRTVTEGRTGDTDNFFVGGSDGALDPRPADSLGVDAKEFVLPDGAVPQGATSAELSFATRGDTFVPAGLAFSVPVPDLEITRTASPREVRPGDVLTYTVTARNTGPADLPAVRFSDDLTGVLDDADHRRDARTDLGTVTYTKHGTAFSGALPAGRTATVTYSVRIKDRPEGDGRLRSGVTSETPRSNCGPGSVDPACATAPALTRPAPPRAAPTQAAPPRTLPTRTAQARPAAGDGKNATPAPPAAAGPASPAPPAPGPRGNTGSMAATGGHGERLWLLGALGLALAATGLVAKAALRGRRDT